MCSFFEMRAQAYCGRWRPSNVFKFGMCLFWLVGLHVPLTLAQADVDFSGLWVLDRSDVRDVYGEIRIIHQTKKEVGLTIIDYGSAWIVDAFRGVVHILPWTFRFDQWGPRRGPPDSKQPKTRAQSRGPRVVLEKSTFSGNGEFTWVWSLDDSRTELLQSQGSSNIYFLRSSPNDPAFASMVQRLTQSGALGSDPPKINVRVNDDSTAVLIDCPEHDCRIVQFENGSRIGTRLLKKGAVAALPLQSEAMIEPAR